MKEKIRSNILVFFDIILINISILLAYLLKFDGGLLKAPAEYFYHIEYLALVATLVKILIFSRYRLYTSLWRYAGTHELLCIVGAAFMGNAVIVGYLFIRGSKIPESIFIIAFFIDVLLIGGIRLSYRAARKLSREGLPVRKDFKRVMVIGGGDAGAMIIKELLQNRTLKSLPAVILDDDTAKTGRKINGVPIAGGRECIVEAAVKNRIDEIIIAIPSAPKKDINAIFSECSKTSCKIRIVPSVSQLIDGSVSIKEVRDVNIEDLLGREPVQLDMEEVSSFLQDQIVLITGGGGSIGSELCRQIASFKPQQLIILDNYENNAYDIQNELLQSYPGLNLRIVIANIRDKSRIDRIFHKYRPEVVFHAAAHKHVPLMEDNPTEAIKNNVFGTMNVAECADKYLVKRFILISSDKAVNPTNIMGATKRIAEMLIQAIDKHSLTEFAAVRFGNVLGSNGSVIPLFKKQIELGGPVRVTHPEINRFFMTIPEAVQLVLQAGAMAKGGEIFVLDMGEPVRIYDLARNLIKLSGFEPDEDIKIEFTGLRPGEKLYEELLLAEEGLKTTKNKKIYIAPPVFTDLKKLQREISKLNDIIVEDTEEIADYIPNIVPAYKKAN